MNLSKNYIFYQYNPSLEKAMKHYQEVSQESASNDDSSKREALASFGYSHFQGGVEQQLYSIELLETAKGALQKALNELSNEASLPSKFHLLESLGSVLAVLGQLQADTALLGLSIEIYNKSLEECNQTDVPKEWATVQNSLANSLLALGQLENRSKWYKASEEANTSALKVWNQSDTPEQWSATMHTLGITFHLLGKLLKGSRTFQKSDVAYKNALSKRDDELMRVDRAMSHNNRGAVLQHMAEREENAEHMEEAIKAYEYSLSFWTEQLLPKSIATMIMANRSTARVTLAEMTSNKAIAEEALDELVLIIELFGEACHPECLEHCQQQLAKANELLSTVGSSEKVGDSA